MQVHMKTSWMFYKEVKSYLLSNAYSPQLIVGIHVQLCEEHVSAKFEGAQFGECCRQNCVYNHSE